MSSGKRNLTNSLLVIFSILFSLYIAETVLLFKDYQDRHPQTHFDSRTKYEIYRDLKKLKSDITIYVSPTQWRKENTSFLPLSGVSNSKTIHCNENNYYSIYSSDRYGFNNPDSEWEKTSVDFLLIGDSYTQGACVNEPDSIAGNLRSLSGHSVLNLGMGGNGPLTEFAVMREYLPRANTKTVFWIYYEENDLTDLRRELKNGTLKKYLEDSKFSQNLATKQSQINKKATALIKGWVEDNQRHTMVKFLYLKLLRNCLTYWYKHLCSKPSSLDDFKKVLTQASELVAKENSLFYFVFIPSRERFRGNQKNLGSKDELFKLVRNLKIPIIDCQASFLDGQTNPLSFYSTRRGHHLNEMGYRLVSKYILKSVIPTVSVN